MDEVTPRYSELRLVSTTPFPEKLFVCHARIKDDVGPSLEQLFNHSGTPDKELHFLACFPRTHLPTARLSNHSPTEGTSRPPSPRQHNHAHIREATPIAQ